MDTTGLNAVVTLCNQVSPWLRILQVVPDGGVLPDYVPGQFLSLGLFGAASRCALAEPEKAPADPHKLIRRAYSIASSPANREFLEFYIALVPGGALSPRLFNLEIGDRIWLASKAAGRFTYDDSKVPPGSNLVLISTSSGLAPFVSMLGTHLKRDPGRRVAVVHGVRHSWDLGYRSILMAMQHLRANVTYIPVVSRPQEEPAPWKGAVGHVQDVWKSGALGAGLGRPPRAGEYACVHLRQSPDERVHARTAGEGRLHRGRQGSARANPRGEVLEVSVSREPPDSVNRGGKRV